MEQQLDRIASAFERIATALEAINAQGLEIFSKEDCLNLSLKGDIGTSIDQSTVLLEGPLCVQHEFSTRNSLDITGKIFVEPDTEAFDVRMLKK